MSSRNTTKDKVENQFYLIDWMRFLDKIYECLFIVIHYKRSLLAHYNLLYYWYNKLPVKKSFRLNFLHRSNFILAIISSRYFNSDCIIIFYCFENNTESTLANKFHFRISHMQKLLFSINNKWHDICRSLYTRACNTWIDIAYKKLL